MVGKKWSSFPFVRDMRRAGVMMFVILAVDVLILAFAVHTLLREIDRQMRLRADLVHVPFVPPAPRPEPARLASFLPLNLSGRFAHRPGYDAPGGITGPFERYGGSCVSRYRDGQLDLTYDVSYRLSSSGFSRSLEGVDLTGFRALEFWIRGETGDEVFAVRLDDGQGADQVHVSRLFPEALPREWQKVAVPLRDFPHIKTWYRLKGTLTFVFDNGFGMPYHGTIHVKDMQFVR